MGLRPVSTGITVITRMPARLTGFTGQNGLAAESLLAPDRGTATVVGAAAAITGAATTDAAATTSVVTTGVADMAGATTGVAVTVEAVTVAVEKSTAVDIRAEAEAAFTAASHAAQAAAMGVADPTEAADPTVAGVAE
jgi:hypothetical protein